jgi:glucose/arabinose dehydrogenase
LDNPIGSSPVFSSGYRGRLDFDWEPVNKGLWHVETDERGVSLGRPNAGQRGGGTVYLDRIQAVGVAFHAGATPAAWRGSVFLASSDQECLYRVAGLSSSPPEPAIERLLANRFGRIVAVLSGDDGLYFATGNGGVDASGQPADAVFRIRDKGVRTDSTARREP